VPPGATTSAALAMLGITATVKAITVATVFLKVISRMVDQLVTRASDDSAIGKHPRHLN